MTETINKELIGDNVLRVTTERTATETTDYTKADLLKQKANLDAMLIKVNELLKEFT